MKKIKVSFIVIFIMCLLSIPSWFIYTRFCLPKYIMEGTILKYKNDTYVRNNYWAFSDKENLGKTIGIGVGEKRTLTDLIWPFWVVEYKNDKEHTSIYLSGLMDSGGKYNKISK